MDEYRADRRRLISAGIVLAGAGVVAGSASRAEGADPSGPAWQPAMESVDSWLDKPGTRHRMMFDTVSVGGGIEALGYANNFIHVNQSDYGLTPEQLGIVIILRHRSTPLGLSDAMWAKYGRTFADQLGLKGKQAIQAVSMNPAIAGEPDAEPPPKGMEWVADSTIPKLAAKGVRFGVCALATAAAAGQLAGKSGNAKAIEAELRANLAPGAVMVPAGIVAVNRVQEHGYTFSYTG